MIREWADEDREHCVVAEDGSYESAQQTAGQYGLQFDGVGISKYACALHGGSGMRGAVVVDVFAGTGVVTVQELTVFGMFGVAITSPLLFGAVLRLKRRRERRRHRGNGPGGERRAGTDRGRIG